MNDRENLLSLLRRQGYERVPYYFSLCPSLVNTFKKNSGYNGGYEDYFNFPLRFISNIKLNDKSADVFLKYYPDGIKPGTVIDNFGVAHEPGSEAAHHMSYMRNPLRDIKNVDDILNYPFPDYRNGNKSHMKTHADAIKTRGLAAFGGGAMSIWEEAWYIRGMENLMVDMLEEDEKADILLDKTAEIAVINAVTLTEAGADVLYMGDDIGMQRTPMISVELYCKYLKPRLKRVIDAAKAINPDIIVIYHSCGYIVPFIPHLIEAGIDVLNPVQPESMSFKELHDAYGDVLSFHGAIGTQTTMPFGSPDDVRNAVRSVMNIAGERGGLMPAPTHLLEPEVPWDNILAYVDACKQYRM